MQTLPFNWLTVLVENFFRPVKMTVWLVHPSLPNGPLQFNNNFTLTSTNLRVPFSKAFVTWLIPITRLDLCLCFSALSFSSFCFFVLVHSSSKWKGLSVLWNRHILLTYIPHFFQLKTRGIYSMLNIIGMALIEPGSFLASRNSLNKGQPHCLLQIGLVAVD